MGLLKHFYSRSRLQETGVRPPPPSLPSPHPLRRDNTASIPLPLWDAIFTYVCPHTQDASYVACEKSQIGDGCMLCDLRDLARCAQVCRRWRGVAQHRLYTSVRIDAVHYCALEQELAERRRKAGTRPFRSRRVVEPVDVPSARLRLLCRTVRDQPRLAAAVLFLKLNFTTRETATADLARTVSALPNLQYVDLPDGFFTGDPTCLTLRHELQARCPYIRKMTYRAGSEEMLELLAQRHWQFMEVLEISALAIEPATLRIVLASMPHLRDLSLSAMDWVDDSTFSPSSGTLPDLPPLSTLTLVETSHVTARGVQSYLSVPHHQHTLSALILHNTGVTVPELPDILQVATSLRSLSFTETVSKSLALAGKPLPPLTSGSLETLHFEITSSDDVHGGLQKPSDSYYAYLASSLQHDALPTLSTLYVRDHTFPDLLLLPTLPTPLHPPTNPFAPPTAPALSHPLKIFSKGLDEHDWLFTPLVPPPPPPPHGTLHPQTAPGPRAATFARPVSAYDAHRGLGPQWTAPGGGARQSVVVGNGFGGFLAIPQEEAPRPHTAGGGAGVSRFVGASGGTAAAAAALSSREKRASRHDLWR